MESITESEPSGVGRLVYTIPYIVLLFLPVVSNHLFGHISNTLQVNRNHLWLLGLLVCGRCLPS
jgi:hypothetical protein